MKIPIYQTEILINARLGIYERVTYYNDGTNNCEFIPKGKIIIPKNYFPEWTFLEISLQTKPKEQ